MTAFCLIINKLRSHLSFVIFAMYPYSKNTSVHENKLTFSKLTN